MIREYAVDPSAISQLRDVAIGQFASQWGMEKGCVISAFPKNWDALVQNEIRNILEVGPSQRKALTELLIHLQRKRRIISFGRPYKPGDPWKVNLIEQHATRPFDEVIVRDICAEIRDAVRIDAIDWERFEEQREDVIPRSAESLAARVGRLLELSRDVIFVDPYFSPAEIRFRRTLQAFLAAAVSGGPPLRKCEYHLRRNDDSALENFEKFRNECELKLPVEVPEGVTLKLVRWIQIDERGPQPGEHLHPRYILTDRGGVRIESGLDEGEGKETTDVSLLTEKVRKRRLDDFIGDPPAFARADHDVLGNPVEVTVAGTRYVRNSVQPVRRIK